MIPNPHYWAGLGLTMEYRITTTHLVVLNSKPFNVFFTHPQHKIQSLLFPQDWIPRDFRRKLMHLKWQPSSFFILPCLVRSCLLLSYDRKLLLCLTPSEDFSLLLRSHSLTCMGAEETHHPIRPTTHCRMQLLLSSKLVVWKIYWENVSEHRAKYTKRWN